MLHPILPWSAFLIIHSRRIRSLETHVAEIRHSQAAIQNVLAEIAAHLRVGSASVRSPSTFPPTYLHHSPAIHADSPASMSTPVSARPQLDIGHPIMTTPQPVCLSLHVHSPKFLTLVQMYPTPPIPTMRPNGDMQASQGSPAYSPINSQYHMPTGAHQSMLPPISAIEPTVPRPQHDNISSVRNQYAGNGHARHFSKQTSVPIGSGAGKRPLAISTATSADSSDVEEDAVVDLPAQGLVAPWEVLRGLADVAIQRAAKASYRHPLYDRFRSCTLVSAGKW